MQKNNSSNEKKQNNISHKKVLKLYVLYNGESFFYEDQILDVLARQKIYAKLAGVRNSTKNNQTFLDLPYYLDLYSTTFIRKVKLLELQYLCPIAQQQLIMTEQNLFFKVFCDLKKKFFLVDAHKFGGNFLAYESDPNLNHATYLVFCLQKQKQDLTQQELNQMSRLSQICKKRCLLCCASSDMQIKYFEMNRQKKVKHQQSKKQYQKNEKSQMLIKQKQSQSAEKIKKKIEYKIQEVCFKQ